MNKSGFERRLREARRRAIESFTLMDDIFMSAVFAGNTECTAFVLSVILGRKLTVTEARAQHELKNLRGRSVRLDVLAEDANGRQYNIEVQREERGAKPKRARYNGSLLDAACADAGSYGEALPETYVIFITERDYWKLGEPLYAFERRAETRGGKVIDFGDGLHVVYVNGAYRGSDAIGDLMHDFSCADPSKMKNAVLRKHTAPYKTSGKGGVNMNPALKEYRDIVAEMTREETIEKTREETAVKAIKRNLPVELIQELSGLSEEKITELQRQVAVEA